MNPTALTLTALALAGALSSGYFWHQIGNQKEEQLSVIAEIKTENTGLRQDGTSLREKLANAEARSEALAKTLEKEKQQQVVVVGQLADSRRENEALRNDSAKLAAQADAMAAGSRALKEEMESFRTQLSSSVSSQAYAALNKQLADSKMLALELQNRINQLTAPVLAGVTQPPASGGIIGTAPSQKNRLVSTKVRQVRGDKVLLGYGARQGAAVNADVRLQDGLDYLGFGRVIYVDENQCLVELNKGHNSILADKDIYLLTPEASEKVTIKE